MIPKPPLGKLGLTAIGNSREKADELYYQTLAVLDRETAYGRAEGYRVGSNSLGRSEA